MRFLRDAHILGFKAGMHGEWKINVENPAYFVLICFRIMSVRLHGAIRVSDTF